MRLKKITTLESDVAQLKPTPYFTADTVETMMPELKERKE